MRTVSRILPSFVGFLCCLALCSQAYAGEIIVQIPDSLISEGAGWEHFSEASGTERTRLLIEKVLLAPQYKWIRDFVTVWYTHGRIRDYDKTGITVRVLDDPKYERE